MGQKGIVFTTELSTKECSDLFKQGANSARGGVARMSEVFAKAAGNGEVTGFFTPNFDSLFAAVDGVPDFAIGIGVLKLNGGAQGNATPVHMYVDEKDGHREVQIVSKYGLMGGRSAKLVRIFFEKFQAADSSLKVTDQNLDQ